MKGLDGIQGPVYVGTGCVFNRQALYGYGPSCLPTLITKKSTSSCSWLCCCCRGKKPTKEKELSEVYRDAKREDLNAAVFNLREIDSKFSYTFVCTIVLKPLLLHSKLNLLKVMMSMKGHYSSPK